MPRVSSIHNEAAKKYQAVATLKSQDVGDIDFGQIDWKRRLKCKTSIAEFQRAYMGDVFNMPNSPIHDYINERIDHILMKGGLSANCIPRGFGKTWGGRSMSLSGMLNGWSSNMLYIGATESKAKESMDVIKSYLLTSPELQQDYPEVIHCIRHAGGSSKRAAYQKYNGLDTYMTWKDLHFRMPTIIIPQDIVDLYLEHDPGSIRFVKTLNDGAGGWINANSAAMLTCYGIESRDIRGNSPTHPIGLWPMRPDMVIIDDIQNDSNAISPTQVDKNCRIIEGAVGGLGSNQRAASALMLCTVIANDDVADRYTNRELYPEWFGIRFGMVTQWPEGITNFEIDPNSAAGGLWLEYENVRRKSYQVHGDNRDGNKFYLANRKELDAGFKVAWESSYDRKQEKSAIQSAMNWRIKNHAAFLAERQQIGFTGVNEKSPMIEAKSLARKVLHDVKYGQCPSNAQKIVAFMDVQEEFIVYLVLAVALDFTGCVIDYGTYPEVRIPYATKRKINSWRLLTTEYFKKFPATEDNSVTDANGRRKADDSHKRIFGLQQCFDRLMQKRYTKTGLSTEMAIDRIGVDCRNWTAAGRLFCANCGITGKCIPYLGEYVSPSRIQYIQQTENKNWIFEHQRFPDSKECRWIYKPYSDGQYNLLVDSNLAKDFAFQRLTSPIGVPGSIALYDAPEEQHRYISECICNSEFPEPMTGREVTKNVWKERANGQDNDLLDAFVGACMIASYEGACVNNNKLSLKPKKGRNLMDELRRKRKQ